MAEPPVDPKPQAITFLASDAASYVNGHILAVDGGALSMGRFLAFGGKLLRLSPPGRELLLQSPRLDVCIAGAEANVAGALARLDHDVGFVS